MFYSQFILAKKGPLGTIWIAAHLERKLRKNQVADTDIGDSVDSILSPDVPIALRLSSHLLLGVVRIYSRKVNYLFHDCSEALLKIKQAFRSTVVDLPPEESTAPYHSITLPETFDLDDFELPDSALQGNYTDHHVGTREQITLQDSVDGTSYTALQFGLDERFGDGDSSQIRLLLDEDLFMHNISSPQLASAQLGTEEGAIHVGQSSNAHTNMDIDGGENGGDGHMNLDVLKLSEVLSNDCDKHDLSSAEKLRMSGDSSRHGYNIQTPDLNQVFSSDDRIGGPSAFPDNQIVTPADIVSSDLFDHAQAPATPGLLEEAVRANVQEIPALSPQEKNLSPIVMDVINTDNSVSPRSEVVAPAPVNTVGFENGVTMEPEPEDAAHSIASLGSNLSEAKLVSLAPECSDGNLGLPDEAHLECGQNSGDHFQSEVIHRTKPVSPVSECLGGFLAVTDAIHLECEQKKSDQTHSGFVCNEVGNMPTMPDCGQNNGDHLQSEIIHRTKPVSPVSECVGGFLAVTDVNHLECEQKKSDQTHSGFVCNEVSNKPTMPECGQNNGDHLQSEIIHRTKPVSPVSECLGGSLAVIDAIHLECEQKKSDQAYSGVVCNEVSNMPTMPHGVETLCPEVSHLGDLVTSSHSIQASMVDMSLNKSTTDEIVVASHDNVRVPGVSSEINTASLWNKADPSFLANQEHAGDVNCYLTSTKSTLGSDLYLRSCNSLKNLDNISPSKGETINEADLLILDNQSHVKNGDSCLISNAPALSSDLHLLPYNLSLNQVNLLSAHSGSLVEDTPVFARSVLTCTSETPSIEQPQHVCGSSLNLQGEDNHTINITNTIQEIYPKSDSVLSNILSHAFDPDGQLTSVFSKGTQPVNLNFSSSGYPEPEKALFATNCDVNMPNDLGQITTEKGFSESTESINQNNSLSGKKHHLTDCSPLLQHSDSVKKSRIPRLKRNAAYMPDDDDLLTSILGGRTPTLRMGPTPEPQKAVQLKRPRLTPKVRVPKRKVLLDDTMVLHADAIRKQLVSIEDIRRMRKKAPCTRPEIWMIQKNAMEEEVFSESLFTGISTELNKLNTKTYGVNENKSSQIVDHHLDEFDLYVQQSKEKERSRMEFDSRNNGKEKGDPAGYMSDQLDCGTQRRSDSSVSILAHHGIEAGVLDAHKKTEPRMSQLEPSVSIPAHNGIEAGVLDAHKKTEPRMSQLEPSLSIPAHNGIEVGVLDAHKKIEPRMSQLEPSVSIPAHNGIEAGVLDAHKKIEPRMSQLEPSLSIPAHNGIEVGVLDAHKKTEPRLSQLEPSVSILAHNGIEAGVLDAHQKIEPRMSLLEPSLSIPAHNGIETGVIDAHKKIEPAMSQLEPSLSILAHNGREAGVLDAHKKIEPRMSQLEPSVSIPAHNDIEAGVLDAHKKIEPRMSQLEPSVSIPAHNGIEAGVLDAHKKIEPHMSQREPSVNDQTVTMSTTDVQGRVGVEMPLFCSSQSVSEIEVSTISNIGEFVHKNTEVTSILQEQELRPDLVQSSDRPLEITDRTSSFAGTAVADAASAEDEIRCRIVGGMQEPPVASASAVGDAASAEDETRCRIVDVGMQEPPVASDSAVGDAASAEDEIRCRIVDGGMQEPPVASASIVADMPLVCSPLSGHEIGVSTVSTSEKEALNIPQESKLVDDSAQPSDKSMEMVDRTPNFGGATVGCVVSSENADRECSIPEDTSISQNKSRMDVLDSNGPQYIHNVGEIENGEILVSMLDRCLLEDRAGMAADSSNVVEHANIIPDVAAEHTVEKMLVDVERPTSEVSCSENAQSISSCVHQQNTETENVPSAVGDNSGLLECIIEGSLDVESARMDGGTARESTGLYNTFGNNDTEFLNADYEPDFDEAEANGMPDTEDSGWSTRTRGVARYLKTLFNEEHGRGRKTIAVDNLLAGKTRKEASRMFFETLVLRTRDYIHVEQETPFDRINIKPGPKLLKSKF